MPELRSARGKGHLVSAAGTPRSYRAYRRTAVPIRMEGPSKALGTILMSSLGMFVSADLVSLALRKQYRYPDNWGVSFPIFG
jgi:hypothetical protein